MTAGPYSFGADATALVGVAKVSNFGVEIAFRGGLPARPSQSNRITASLAVQYRLGFVPVIDERYDVLVERREWFSDTWQSLFRFCQTPAFHYHARELAGYDIGAQFQIHFNGAG